VPEETDNTTPRGPLRVLYEWLTRTPSPSAGPAAPIETPTPGLPARIAHYALTRQIGRGGMGVVYAARDERLERTVALKTMSSLATDEHARERFWREARAAASVNHPNVCQIYEIGEEGGRLFIAMELLEGETLADRMRAGPMNVTQAVPIGLEMLAALAALHARAVVHRDLKPSNVFLTAHGVKLLDFGLARPGAGPAPGAASDLTRTGIVMGTPRYMAPEQMLGQSDARSDLFAAGAILFEMLAGRPAFAGRNVGEILHATLHEQPPALTGSPAIAAIDRVIRRALAKAPAERPASAEAMAGELRSVGGAGADQTSALARAMTRLVVLPFRVLRADAETDFLAYSLPDAIATSLSGIGPLIVRSSATAARFAGDAPDLKVLAADAGVDRVVIGTLLRQGDQLRVSTQLVDTPSGTLIASHTVQSSLGDLFRLQDDVARRIVEALALPLGGRTQSPPPDAPHDQQAYELYLRANEMARTYDGLPRARGLYQRCVELDPQFAPAWAHLGRCHRVIGKYIAAERDSESLAEDAFRRALEINPRLSIAHKFYANLEADIGEAPHALVRLLGEAGRRGNDAELFAGLVHACRYCGLYEQSLAAHREARRLDPNAPTGMEQTLLMMGRVDQLMVVEVPVVAAGADDGIRVIALGLAGRHDEAREALARMQRVALMSTFRIWTDALLAWLDRRVPEMKAGMAALGPLKIAQDPEAIFQEGLVLCDVGDDDEGVERLHRAVAKGYFPVATLEDRPQFDRVRATPAFQAVLREAQVGRDRALASFRDAGGERLLGR
jgi:non-specific serine/threonine protein kinase